MSITGCIAGAIIGFKKQNILYVFLLSGFIFLMGLVAMYGKGE